MTGYVWFRVGSKVHLLTEEAAQYLATLARDLGSPAYVESAYPEPAPPQDGSFGRSPAMDALDDIRKLQAADTPAIDLSFIQHRLDRIEAWLMRVASFDLKA